VIEEVVGGRYRVLETLRQGGLATTYRALDQSSDELVALVVVPVPPEPHHLVREFRIGSGLSHPNLPKYRTIFEWAGHAALVMDLIVGEALVPVLSDQTARFERADARGFSQLCGLLDYLHSKKLVHANLDPEDLLVEPTGCLKVLRVGHCEDLGAAEVFWNDGPHGTPRYSSPEHCFGGQLRVESDYFVVGVLLHERLTGCYPFPEETLGGLLTAIHHGAAQISRSLEDVHPALGPCVRHLLHLDFSVRRHGWHRLQDALAAGYNAHARSAG
jgi:serine/threonine protein kinase